jgi:hypothetical protein
VFVVDNSQPACHSAATSRLKKFTTPSDVFAYAEVKRTLNSNRTNERVKITLSDGEAFMQGFIATQAAEQGQGLVNLSVINVHSYIITPLNTTVQCVPVELCCLI